MDYIVGDKVVVEKMVMGVPKRGEGIIKKINQRPGRLTEYIVEFTKRGNFKRPFTFACEEQLSRLNSEVPLSQHFKRAGEGVPANTNGFVGSLNLPYDSDIDNIDDYKYR